MNTAFSFIYNFKSISLYVVFSDKTFSASYNSSVGEMNFTRHIMLICPKIFTEQSLRDMYCSKIAAMFLKTEMYLRNNPDFITNKKTELDFLLSDLESEKLEIQNRRRELRSQLKNRCITTKEYTPICKQYRECNLKISEFKYQFINSLSEETGVVFECVKNLF